MKARNCFGTILIVSLIIAGIIPVAYGIDGSADIWLDRYTILEDGSLQHDSGNLLGKGEFRVLLSEIMDPFWVNLVGIEAFAPISGKAIMDASMFDGYKAAGVIPKWTRSPATYNIGYVSYVIVMPKGFKPVTIKSPLILRPVKVGKLVKLKVSVQGSKPFTYQWYYNSIPYNPVNDFSTWYQGFTPIDNATNKFCAIANAQVENVGTYYVIVRNTMSSATSGLLWLDVRP